VGRQRRRSSCAGTAAGSTNSWAHTHTAARQHTAAHSGTHRGL
jgi:hypothetical protein